MNKLMTWNASCLATCFFLTYPLDKLARRASRPQTGAGLIGSLAGLACVPLLPSDNLSCLLALLGATVLSVVISEVAEESLGRKDDQRIVIDEWIGYLVSVAFLPATRGVLLAGFILFRVLDSWKPLGIKRLAAIRGGWGIVIDDLAAGILTNAILRLLPLS